MKKVLMVCYYYPPIGGIGAERPLQFSRLLPDFGWEPVVLTVKEGTLRAIEAGEGMGEPSGVRVIRTRNPDIEFRLKRALGFDLSQRVEAQLGGFVPPGEKPRGLGMQLVGALKNWLEIPDRLIDWYPFLVRAGLEVAREEHFDALYAFCVPYTPAVAAARISRSTSLPWVADLPDLWTRDFNYMRTGSAVRLDRRLERRTLAEADAIIVNSGACRSILASAYPDLTGRISEIPLAYDGELFDSVEPIREDLLNVVYAGTMYHPYQDPGPFLEAAGRIRGEGRDLSRFRLQYMGRDGAVLVDLARRAGVGDLVQDLGQLEYAEALARQKGAKALLYVQWEPGGEVVATGKLMQYLGARRPVLALAPTPGEADRLVESTGCGSVARDPAKVASVLVDWLDQYNETGDIRYAGHREEVARYSYRSAAERLAGLLDGVTVGSRAHRGA